MSEPRTEPTEPQDAGALVEVSGLVKSFGELEVLKGIDFTVPAGSVTVLIGPSGSGKTTVLRSMNTLDIPDSGLVRIADAAVDFAAKPGRRELAQLRAQSAMVFQGHNLFPHMSVRQNVMEGPVTVQRRPADEVRAEADRLLEQVGLTSKAEQYPHQLSGGQQQRVGIARALALKPKLMLFDEPTSALDPELVGEVLSVMKDLAGEGWTMLVVTHEIRFAQSVANQVLFMDGGVVVESGSPVQVLTEPSHPRTRTFLDRVLNPI